MTAITYTALFLSVTALVLSIGACVVTRRSWELCQQSKSAKLSQLLLDQGEELERLSLQLRNLKSRLNMQAYRERRQPIQDPEPVPTIEDQDPDAENARIRAELNGRLARGELKTGP